jgi:hypothetical protein
MNKPVLYIFDNDDTLEEIETDVTKMKKYIKEYEDYTKRIAEEIQRDSSEA